MINLFIFYNHWQVPCDDVVCLKAYLKIATARKLGMPGRISVRSTQQSLVTETNMASRNIDDNKPFLGPPLSYQPTSQPIPSRKQWTKSGNHRVQEGRMAMPHFHVAIFAATFALAVLAPSPSFL